MYKALKCVNPLLPTNAISLRYAMPPRSRICGHASFM
jgi:hypothetical protein